MDWTRFNKVSGYESGYEMWRRRLGYVPYKNIEQTIVHLIGLEDLVGKKHPKDQKCPSCMIGKSTLENYQGIMQPASRLLVVVHMDIYSSLIPSIEGYNHFFILTDSYAEYQSQYGMKTRNETMSMVKLWMADIADVWKDHLVTPVLVVVKDNAGENTSKELNDYFTECGVKQLFQHTL